jgi:hypothetical protein
MALPDPVMELVKAANPVREGEPPAFDTVRVRIAGTAGAASDRSPRRRSRPSRMRSLLLAVVALLVIAGGALAAGGVIRLGAPVRRLVNPHSRFGALSKGTVRLLAISTPDPAGGPPWGMRIYSTTRGSGCIQVGRLLYGKLGAIGEDGAFQDDGLFHPTALAEGGERGCTVLDGDGRIFLNVMVANESASGIAGIFSDGCVPAGTPPLERTNVRGRTLAICPQQDERNLYYGLLGPDATSVTYVLDGHRHTQATVGPEGAYLIVAQAPRHQLFEGPDGGTTDVVPVDGPITEMHYRNGATCHLTARSWIGGKDSCTPELKGMPFGWVAPRAPALTAAQVLAPVRARLVHNRKAGYDTGAGGYELVVSFTARVAVRGTRSGYRVQWHEQNEPSQVRSGAETPYDVSAGQIVTARGGHYPTLQPGLLQGTVTFVQDRGPGNVEEGPGTVELPVGHFTLRVP